MRSRKPLRFVAKFLFLDCHQHQVHSCPRKEEKSGSHSLPSCSFHFQTSFRCLLLRLFVGIELEILRAVATWEHKNFMGRFCIHHKIGHVMFLIQVFSKRSWRSFSQNEAMKLTISAYQVGRCEKRYQSGKTCHRTHSTGRRTIRSCSS